MSKDVILTVRVPSELRDEINSEVKTLETTQADWLRDAIEAYLKTDGQDSDITRAELNEMSWQELEDLIQELDLDTDPNDYSTTLIMDPDDNSEDADNLRQAIAEELEISDEDPDEDPDED
jgi:predicted DNA-binding protein